jgi:hypothetical protein
MCIHVLSLFKNAAIEKFVHTPQQKMCTCASSSSTMYFIESETDSLCMADFPFARFDIILLLARNHLQGEIATQLKNKISEVLLNYLAGGQNKRIASEREANSASNGALNVAARNSQGVDKAARESVSAASLTMEKMKGMTTSLKKSAKVMNGISKEASELSVSLKKAQGDYEGFTDTRLACNGKVHKQEQKFSKEKSVLKKRERDDELEHEQKLFEQKLFEQKMRFKRLMIKLEKEENTVLEERANLTLGLLHSRSGSVQKAGVSSQLQEAQQAPFEAQGQEEMPMEEDTISSAALAQQGAPDAMTEDSAEPENAAIAANIEVHEAPATVTEPAPEQEIALPAFDPYLTESDDELGEAVDQGSAAKALGQAQEGTNVLPDAMQIATAVPVDGRADHDGSACRCAARGHADHDGSACICAV